MDFPAQATQAALEPSQRRSWPGSLVIVSKSSSHSARQRVYGRKLSSRSLPSLRPIDYIGHLLKPLGRAGGHGGGQLSTRRLGRDASSEMTHRLSVMCVPKPTMSFVNQGVRRSTDVEWNGLDRAVRLVRVRGPLPEDSHGATVDNAMAEIVAGRLPLAQRALNACFPSRASFTRAFRRATGMTPTEYRRRRRNTPVRISLAARAPGVQIDRNSAEI